MADESLDSSPGRATADEDITVNKSGQSLGQKGHRTRQRILQAHDPSANTLMSFVKA